MSDREYFADLKKIYVTEALGASIYDSMVGKMAACGLRDVYVKLGANERRMMALVDTELRKLGIEVPELKKNMTVAVMSALFRITPLVMPNDQFYRIDTALRLPAKAATDWSMKVHGLVERELTVTYQDLLNRPLIERPVTLTCVSNEVGGNLISTANFIGVSLRDLLLEAGVHPEANQLFSTSLDGFTAGTPTEVVMEPDRGAMLALGMNSAPLPLEHGYPVRMVVPGLYGYVSATKWLADLELTTFDAKQSYWLQRGWAQLAPIKTQSRIDRPRSGGSVAAGQVTAAGIAWAQHRGIAGVQVRLDGGPWQPARLSTEVGADTWRMWLVELTVPPGHHTLECRATDTTGVTQTEVEAPPVPDGMEPPAPPPSRVPYR